jgi:hypothetical protein
MAPCGFKAPHEHIAPIEIEECGTCGECWTYEVLIDDRR